METDLTQSLTRRLPWAVTAAVTVGFIAAWPKPAKTPAAQPEPATTVVQLAPTSTVSAATSSAVVPSSAAPRQLALLDTCMKQLQRHQARGRAAAKTATQNAAKPSKDDVARCLALDEVVAAIDSACDDEPTPPQPIGKDGFARRFSSKVVGVPDEDVPWLEEYMCRVHRLRENMVADLRSALEGDEPAGDEVIDELLADAQDARDAALADVKARLGEERYARLRSVGGLGMLAASLDCSEDAP